jgi:hypothetical protein
MKINRNILLILTIAFIAIFSIANATDKYEYVKSSELDFKIKFEDNRYSGTLTEFINPVTKLSGLYVKLNDTKITSLTCNGKNIALKNDKINDSLVETVKYGNIKLGLWGQGSNDLIVWLKPDQKKAFQKLISSE